jgi:hypothetical protein
MPESRVTLGRETAHNDKRERKKQRKKAEERKKEKTKKGNKLAYFYLAGFKVVAEVNKKIAVFWVVPPHSSERA